MPLTVNASDLRDAYFKINNTLYDADDYDFIRSGTTAHKFDVTVNIEANILEDVHLHVMNYTMSKWRQLVRNYLNVQELEKMIARLRHYQVKIGATGYCMDIAMGFKSRDNASGSCLLAITLGRNCVEGWVCHVYSRASELTVRFYADIIFINRLLHTICTEIGIDPERVKIRWHMASTYQSVTSMPWFLVLAGREDELMGEYNKLSPGDRASHGWRVATALRFAKSYVGDSYMTFRVQRRPAEAYRMLKGILPSRAAVWTEDLVIPRTEIDFQIGDDGDDE